MFIAKGEQAGEVAVELVVRLGSHEVPIGLAAEQRRVNTREIKNGLSAGCKTVSSNKAYRSAKKVGAGSERIKRFAGRARIVKRETEARCAITHQVVPALRSLILRSYSKIGVVFFLK